MKSSRVVGIFDAHNKQIVPAYLGDFPKGALLLQLEESSDSDTKEAIHYDEHSAYWNSREWSVIDVGGACSFQGRLAHWIVIANGHKS